MSLLLQRSFQRLGFRLGSAEYWRLSPFASKGTRMQPTSHNFLASDGTRLTWHEIGDGRPLVLIHGLFSSAEVNWIKYGTAQRIAGLGRRVIMPDLRAHGDSEKPHDSARYPPDILSHDTLELIAHLGLTDHDLGGYSLGARSALRAVLMGATPQHLVIAGMGLDGILNARAR